MKIRKFRWLLKTAFLAILFFTGLYVVNGQTADFTVNVQQGCVPLSGVNFTDISSGGTVISRNWNLGNGTIIPNGAATVGTNYLTDGTFPVTLTVTFSGGIVRSITKNITVYPKPKAAFNANDSVGCIPHSVSFQDLSSSTTGIINTWQWDFGAGGSNQQNPSFIYANSGLYQVSLIVKNSWGCSSDAESKPAYIKVYPKPVAGFTANPSYRCDAPLTVNFTNTTSGTGPVKYEWDFGDGSPLSSLQNPLHTYNASGRYTVKLSAQLGNNCISTFSTNYYTDIWVGRPHPSINSSDTVCVNNAINFSGTAIPASLAYNFKWIFGDDNTSSNGTSVNHRFLTPGDFQIMLVSSTYQGCSDTTVKMVHVKPGPGVDFTSNKTDGCSLPFTVAFTGNATPATGLMYQWNFGDGNTSTLRNPVHAYLYAGNFSVTLTVTDTSIVNGCSASLTKNSFIKIRIPTVNFTYVPPEGCLPLPVMATAQIGNLIEPVGSLIWNWGDGATSTITNGALAVSHTYTTAGSPGIQLTLITQSGCSYSSVVKNVSVISVCDDDGGGGGGGGGGGAGFGIGKNCNNKYEVDFTDTVSNTVVTEWDFGDGTILNTGVLNPVTHNYSPPQKIYLVKVTRRDTLTGTTSTGQKNIIIIDEKANFFPDITDICQNKKVQLATIGIDSSKIKKYTWDFGDGTPRYVINNLSYFNSLGLWLNGNTSHTYTTNGLYKVKLIIEDKIGCIDSLEYTVPVTVKGPLAGFAATNITSCDSSQIVLFTDTSSQNGSTPITSRAWMFGDGSPVFNTNADTPFIHPYFNTAYYNSRTVTLTITDAIGCASTITKNNYIKGYRPKAHFYSYDTLKCNSYNILLYNNSSAYNATYKWDYGDGTTSSAYNGSHTYLADGIFNIKLIAKDENSCIDSVVIPNYIKIIKPAANFIVGDTSQCAPAAITYRDSSQYAKSWYWDFGDSGTGSTDQNPAPHIYAKPGIYKVQLIITSVNGCVDSAFKWVRIRGPIGTLLATSADGCKPFTFDASVKGSFIKTYSWDFGDGTPVNASTSDSAISHKYINTGKYLPNVVLISPEGCPYTLKLADTLTIDSVKALFDPVQSTFCGNGAVTFNDLSTTTSFSSITKYAWDFGDGSPQYNSASPPPHSYGPGNYTVSLNVASQYGCTDTFKISQAVRVFALPEVSILGDSILCRPGKYRYVAKVVSIDTIKTYLWKINGVIVSNNNLPEIDVPFNAGNYQISVEVFTQNNCTSTTQRSIIVDSVKTLFDVENPVQCGSGNLTVNFKNLSGSEFGIASYQWDFGDGQTSSIESPDHLYANAGHYDIRLIAHSVNSCADTLTIPQKVIIYASPVITINGVEKSCMNNSLYFTSQIISEDSITKYEWTVNGVSLGNRADFDHYFDKADNYNVLLSIFTKYGCAVTKSKEVIIHPLPVPDAHPDTTVCEGYPVSLRASDGNLFEWSPITAIQNPQTSNPIASPLQTTLYKVKVTNEFGCVAYDSVNIKADRKVRLQHSEDAIICEGDKIKLTASGNTSQFVWSPLEGLSTGTGKVTYANPVTTTTYRIIGLSENVCPSDTGYVTLTVGELPTVNLGPDLKINAGSPLTLSPSTTGNITRYIWSPTTGLSCVGCEFPSLITDFDITYQLKVFTEYGCEATDQINITVLCNKGSVYIPNAFTPNHDGLNDVFYISGYGISKVKQFNIYDRWGKLVFKKENFQAGNPAFGWNGRVNGEEIARTSVFVYTVIVECSQGNPIALRGTVTVIK
ncbi:MAG: PKD domain-containing protein [Ginsengibacter sp.]